MAIEEKLTTPGFWEEYWDKNLGNQAGPKESVLLSEIYRIIDHYLPPDPSLSILEIGGAPGNTLIHIFRKFGYSINSMDYSAVGNEKTRETFRNNGIPVTVYEKDLFSPNEDMPKFDIVCSLGFIEHFDNPLSVVARHTDLLKPGGILMIGVPNLGGIYHLFLKHLSPSHDITHNLKIMDLKNWNEIERKLDLATVFKGYIGGFEPMIMKKLDEKSGFNQFLLFIVKVLMIIFSFRMRFLRKFNSRYWSGYLIGIYRKG